MVVCSYCDKTYASVGSLNRHSEKIHGIKAVKGSMECLSCGKKFTRRMKLAEHLKMEHGQDFEVDLLEFKTSEEFESWRADEEKRSVSMFRKIINDRPSKNGSFSLLICCREGKPKIKPLEMRQRSLKSQGTKKIGHTCTSHMVVHKVLQPVNKIIVKYVKTHYGHEPEVQHTIIGQADKKKIVEQLALGVSEARIISDAAVNEAGPSRLEILNKKDIANIRCQYGISQLGGRRHQNEMVNVDMWVDEDTMEEKSSPCVKYSKKYGEEDLEFGFENEDFLVIITEEQANFLKYLEENLKYKDRFTSLPISNQQEVIRCLRTSSLFLKGSLRGDAIKENHKTEKMNCKKRKITKQDILCKKVEEIEKPKKLKTEAKKTGIKVPCSLFKKETKLKPLTLWLDCPVDHEEEV